MKTVLLTGVTGAIGSVVGRLLLDQPETQIRLLIRAQSREHLHTRLLALYDFWRLDPASRDATARIRAVIGDVTQSSLGLDAVVYRELASEVTHVIHSAGNVKLNRPLEEARHSAVSAAGEIVAFVEACAPRQFKKLEFVSTVGVAGDMPGVVPEQPFIGARAFRNSYEAAKAEAETLVLERIGRGLPATIHRPSMVVGHSKDGAIIQFQVFYYLCEFLSGRRTHGVIPKMEGIQLDIVPVDYVASALVRSGDQTDASGRIFHLCSGPAQAPFLTDLAAEVRRFFAAHDRPVPPVRVIAPSLVRTLLPIMTRLAPARLKRSLESLPHFLAYLDMPQTFGNTETQDYFSAIGLHLPPVRSYLETVLGYYVSHAARAGQRSAQAVA